MFINKQWSTLLLRVGDRARDLGWHAWVSNAVNIELARVVFSLTTIESNDRTRDHLSNDNLTYTSQSVNQSVEKQYKKSKKK